MIPDGNRSDSPVDTLNRPVDALNRPVDALNRPVDALNRPVAALNRPVGTLNRAVGTLNRPVDALNRPVAALNRPVDALNRPVDALNRPVAAWNRPVDALNRPVDENNPPQLAADAAGLAEYDITPADSIALAKEYSDYETLIAAPADSIAGRSARTQALRPTFREASATLLSLDRLVVRFRRQPAGPAFIAN